MARVFVRYRAEDARSNASHKKPSTKTGTMSHGPKCAKEYQPPFKLEEERSSLEVIMEVGQTPWSRLLVSETERSHTSDALASSWYFVQLPPIN